MKYPVLFALSSVSLSLSQVLYAGDVVLDSVVVTTPAMMQPLLVETNTKAPRQPVPAHDGADYLKTIPGFSVIRKGGTDGDPVLRGMAGSRLGILVDGQTILGGCNMRMDAPTAYIYPEVFDKLTVLKGPSVLYGAGNSAGVVMFERDNPSFTEPAYRFLTSLLVASNGRHDELIDGVVGNRQVYARIAASNSESGDYRDGAGNDVHSEYHRYNFSGSVAWTPNTDTKLELSGVHSNGEAAYADRGMDGTKFLREGVALSYEQKNLSPMLNKLSVHVGDNSVDHIMDDQTLRKPGMMGYANLTRDTTTARIAADLNINEQNLLVVGADTAKNSHESRTAKPNGVYSAWSDDAKFSQVGAFAELTHVVDEQALVKAGVRIDDWTAKDQRAGMLMDQNTKAMVANPSSGKQRDDTLYSGFVRFERQQSEPLMWFAGLGHTERFPDYWELISKQSEASASAFNTKPETTNQLDVGLIYQNAQSSFGASAFYNRINDFILVDNTTKKSTGATRNIDAETAGFEFDYQRALNSNWKVNSSLSYVYGANRTDHTALAQLPPLEGRMGVNYQQADWSVGGLMRVVAAQDRSDPDKGNIAGVDIGDTGGFSVFSVNASWKPLSRLGLSAGVDNLFDREYAEAISRASGNGMGGAISGYQQTTRVNEPGRTLWLKGNYVFD